MSLPSLEERMAMIAEMQRIRDAQNLEYEMRKARHEMVMKVASALGRHTVEMIVFHTLCTAYAAFNPRL